MLESSKAILESLHCLGVKNQVLNNFKDSFLQKYIINQNKYKPTELNC